LTLKYDRLFLHSSLIGALIISNFEVHDIVNNKLMQYTPDKQKNIPEIIVNVCSEADYPFTDKQFFLNGWSYRNDVYIKIWFYKHNCI